MKIIIMTDMECVSGITCDTYLDRTHPFYQQTRANFTDDVNAAAEGCFQAGAGEVWVRLGHGQDTVIVDRLDPRVTLRGEDRENWGGIDTDCTAALMLGQHAKAGTIDAFLDHTQSGTSVFEHTINGISLGEIGQWALLCGHFNVPVVFLAGDLAACVEAEALLPGIRTVSVGAGTGRQRMAPRNPVQVRREITAGTADALKNLGKSGVRPYCLKPPYTVRVTFFRTDMADQICRLRSDRRRVDARTVEMVVDSAREILNIFV